MNADKPAAPSQPPTSDTSATPPTASVTPAQRTAAATASQLLTLMLTSDGIVLKYPLVDNDRAVLTKARDALREAFAPFPGPTQPPVPVSITLYPGSTWKSADGRYVITCAVGDESNHGPNDVIKTEASSDPVLHVSDLEAINKALRAYIGTTDAMFAVREVLSKHILDIKWAVRNTP